MLVLMLMLMLTHAGWAWAWAEVRESWTVVPSLWLVKAGAAKVDVGLVMMGVERGLSLRGGRDESNAKRMEAKQS